MVVAKASFDICIQGIVYLKPASNAKNAVLLYQKIEQIWYRPQLLCDEESKEMHHLSAKVETYFIYCLSILYPSISQKNYGLFSWLNVVLLELGKK